MRDECDSLPVWIPDGEFASCYDEFCHQVSISASRRRGQSADDSPHAGAVALPALRYPGRAKDQVVLRERGVQAVRRGQPAVRGRDRRGVHGRGRGVGERLPPDAAAGNAAGAAAGGDDRVLHARRVPVVGDLPLPERARGPAAWGARRGPDRVPDGELRAPFSADGKPHFGGGGAAKGRADGGPLRGRGRVPHGHRRRQPDGEEVGAACLSVSQLCWADHSGADVIQRSRSGSTRLDSGMQG